MMTQHPSVIVKETKIPAHFGTVAALLSVMVFLAVASLTLAVAVIALPFALGMALLTRPRVRGTRPGWQAVPA